MSRDSTLCISAGREFQRVGAATQKVLSPKVFSLGLGMESKPEFEESSLLTRV